MAESAVTFLFNQLTFLLQQKRELLGGIGNNAAYIRDELGQMRAYLRAVDEKEESNPQLKEWVKQLREIAYDTEDILERVENISRNRHMYGFKDEGSSNETHDTRGDALLLEEADVVGIEKPKKQLLDWLMQSDDGLKVISLVGMGGLGKTTLVKKVYDDASMKANFDTQVWVTVSENFNLENLLRNMISRLATVAMLPPPQNLEAMTSDDMKEYVNDFLKERTYMIVLDDIWKIDAWESIRYAFPRKSAARCRIIITTRSYNVGNAACSETNGHLYRLDPLTDEKSEDLFYRKAFPRSSCPPYLNEISKNILQRCQGLPLAIVVIGGLLATKDKNFEDWKMFERTIGLELQGDSFKTMNKILSLSYYDLPYYLKACFLYLSIFPEDELLSKWKVIRLWIAEGFVGKRDGMTQEEVAESYLNDLLNRSLIQVADTYRDGRPKKFRIHDILLEYIISKSREHNLLVAARGDEMKGPDKIRRMAIHTTLNDTKESYNVKYLRSLFSWDSKSGLIFQKVLGGRCRLLKVLDIRGAPLDSIPHEVFKLYCLKSLSLRGTNVRIIPKSIGNLRNLETLDLKKSKVTELPVQILELHKLRNLLVYSYNIRDLSSLDDVQSFKAPFEIGCHLTCLQKLCYIDADDKDGIKIVREIGKLTQLRRLCITKLRRKDGMGLCSSLAKLTNLRTLEIISIEEDEVMDLDHSLPPSTFCVLRTLQIHGRLEKLPQWVHSLHGLTRLGLSCSRLIEDPLQYLGVLPNLVSLEMGKFSYEGKGLIFQCRKFQKLKILYLSRLRELRYVRVEMGSMHHLEELVFHNCEVLEELPEGIEHLSNLQLVEFANMPERFNERVSEQKSKGGHEWKLAHVPKVGIWDLVDGKLKQRTWLIGGI